jgi:hypothetical protein
MFPRITLREQLGTAFAFLEGFDPGAGRPMAAGVDDGTHGFRIASKHCLNRAIAAVAHPTVDAVQRRGILDEGTVAHRLYPTAHPNVPNDPLAHPISPVATPSLPQKPGIKRSSVAT